MRHKDKRTDRKKKRKKKRQNGVRSILRELAGRATEKAEEQGRGGPGDGRCRRPRERSGEESAKGARSETHSDGRVGRSSKGQEQQRQDVKEGRRKRRPSQDYRWKEQRKKITKGKERVCYDGKRTVERKRRKT